MTTAPEQARLRHARSLIGAREAAGVANGPTIMGEAKKINGPRYRPTRVSLK